MEYHKVIKLLRTGFDPDFEGGVLIRMAALLGLPRIVNTLLEFGANPHLSSDGGATALQIAVCSHADWDTDNWTCLLSCCDSSQLADGAAVALIYNNVLALKKILATGRCGINVPTTLTGKTLELMAEDYNIDHLVNSPTTQNYNEDVTTMSPRIIRVTYQEEPTRATSSRYHAHRNLSPSVARFFHQTANQPSLLATRKLFLASSPTCDAASPHFYLYLR